MCVQMKGRLNKYVQKSGVGLDSIDIVGKRFWFCNDSHLFSGIIVGLHFFYNEEDDCGVLDFSVNNSEILTLRLHDQDLRSWLKTRHCLCPAHNFALQNYVRGFA
jgi:hypothetical protein